MTRRYNAHVKCNSCGKEFPTCPSCGAELHISTPFSLWLRDLPEPFDSKKGGFSNHNLDYIWHNYKEGWFVTLEEKRYAGKSTFSQWQTHTMLSALLKVGSNVPVFLPTDSNGTTRIVPIEYRGHFVIKFEQTTPMNSKWCYINGARFDGKNVLLAVLYLLKTGLPPRHLEKDIHSDILNVAEQLMQTDGNNWESEAVTEALEEWQT